jgi:hypothetical protein
MKEFKKWVQELGSDHVEATFLNDALQQVAFTVIAKQKNCALMGQVFEIFRLDLIKHDLIEPIKGLCAEGKYKEVI